MDVELARIRTDQATAKFLPELLNSREFCDRYEIRRRPSACARLTSRLLWAFAGAAMLLLAALAFPQLQLLLGGDVGRAPSTGNPTVVWPAAFQQLQQPLPNAQHLPNAHPYQHSSHPGKQAQGDGPAARVAGASVTVARMLLEAFGMPPAAASPSDPHPPGTTAQQPAASLSTAAPPAEQLPWSKGTEASTRAPEPTTPPSSPQPAPPSPPAGAAATAPHHAEPHTAATPESTPEAPHNFAQERSAQAAHHRHTAPPGPKVTLPPPPPPPISSPLSAASLDLRFRCGQWQPPAAPALLWHVARAAPHKAAPNTDLAAAAAPVVPDPAVSVSATRKVQPFRPLLAALVVVSGLLVLALAMLVATAVSLAAPLADCLSVVLPSAGPAGAAAEVDPDGSKTPAAGPPAASPSSTAVSHTPAITADAAQPLPTADSRPTRSPAPRPQQLQPTSCSPVTHSPMESAAASGGTWSSRSSGGGADDCELDAVLVDAAAASSAGLSAAQQVKAPAAEAGGQAPDTAPAGMWAQFETPSRAPSFCDQLPPLPEVVAVSSVPTSELQPQQTTAAPQPQASGGHTIAPQGQQPSTPSAGTTSPGSAATGAAVGRSRLPSVLRPLVAYGSTPVAQAPAAAVTADTAAAGACAAATPSAASDGASPPLDATFSAAPWPFAYPDSVERARLTATPTASTTSTSGSEGVRAAAAAAAAAALTPAVWSNTAALPAVGGGKDEDSRYPIFDLSRYDTNGDELPLLPPLSPTAAPPPPPLSVLPDPITVKESAAGGGMSAAADGGADRQPPNHRWRLVKKAVALKLHGARRTATDTSAHRDSQQVAGSVSGGSSAGSSSGGGLASGAAVNAALQAAADAPADQAVETPRLACAVEQQLQRGVSLTQQLPEAADMETPVWPPLHGRQARRAGAAAAEADPAGLDGGGACGGGNEGSEEVESSGHFTAEALTLADCLSAARVTRGGGAVKAAGAEADVGPLGAWSFCGEPAADFSITGVVPGALPRPLPGPTAAAAHSPSISSLLPPPAFARASEASREHAAAAAAAVATLQSLKLSARRLVEATRAGSYWRPQDGPEPAGGAAADQELRAAQTELHAAASQLKQLRLTGPSGSAPAAVAPARKALAFTPAATPFAAVAAGAKMPRHPLADISTSAGSAAAGAVCWDGSAGGAASPPLVPLHLGTPAAVDDGAATTMAAGAHAFSTPSATADSAGGLSSILAEVAEAAAAKATQAGQLSPADLAPPGNNELTGETRRLRYGLPRLVPWPALATPESQQSRPPAPAPTPATGTTAALPGGLPTSAGRGEQQVQDLDSGAYGGSSTRSSSDGSAGAADSNKENCQPSTDEAPKDHSDASPASSSPASFHLAGHELPSDAEVQAFLAAAARSQSPAGAATAAPPPPLSPLESLLRVLPAAVEVLVVQLCALADLAAERQREVLAWHYQANACTVPLPFLPDLSATAADGAATEQLSPVASGASTASLDAAPAPADVATVAAAAAAAGGELVAAARCNSAEGRALVLIGRLVDDLLMAPSAEGLALELQAQAHRHEQEQAQAQAQQLYGQALPEMAGAPLGVEQLLMAGDAVDEFEEGGRSSFGSAELSDIVRAASEHPQRMAQPPQPQPKAPAVSYAGLPPAFLAYLEEEDTFSLWSPSNAAAALYHEWAAEPPSAAAAERATGLSPPSSIFGPTLLLPVDDQNGVQTSTPQSSSGSCAAGGAATSSAVTAAPPSPERRRGDHDSGGGAYLRSVARARAAAGEGMEWRTVEEGEQEHDEEDELRDRDAGSRVGPWETPAFQRSGAPSPDSPYARLRSAAAAATTAMAMAGGEVQAPAGGDGGDASAGDSDSGQHAATPAGRRLRVFAGMDATLPVPAAPFADAELEAAGAEDSGATTEPPSAQGSADDVEYEMTPEGMSTAGTEGEGLPPRGYSAAALAAWSPMPDTPGSQRALWRPRLPAGNLDA
ncbi:hypothetical protein HXX76_008759 [Chlamydomonas incerta]|uniref:Uncharacterized protein n=1 Tax=Chlamydomonas incerta TaxID=51695 RepID=A0A835VXK1_CHLIN|nr:hypothetical protein HXX76_008759 [Chlamydomonas incerta]|eukprot:KAG2433032.1 hypothetical protein HXX76_008759 [Chlamydomonas incerta]